MANMCLLATLLTCLLLPSLSATYQKYLITTTKALCLDGTPSAYYSYKGDPDKVILYFQGGGWCGANTLSDTLQSCYQRSFTALGSSIDYPKTLQFTAGILSDSSINYFQNWTKVFITSCDGSGYQGSNQNPIEYKGKKLYFRGQDTVKERLQSLDKQIGIFSKVNNLIVSGGSAGALGVYFWVNYIRENSKAQNLWGVPDSGIFLDQPDQTGNFSYRNGFLNIMKIANIQTNPPIKQCVQQYPNQTYKCLFVQNFYQYINVPLFNVQSLYDSWSLANILGLKCYSIKDLSPCNSSDRLKIQAYHQKIYNLLQKITSKQGNGGWAPVCVNHCYIQYTSYQNQDYKIPANSIYSPNLSLKKWIFKEGDQYNYNHIESGSWPSNTPCSNNSPNFLQFYQ